MTVLVVEDDQKKMQRVATCLLSAGLSPQYICECRDVTAARRLLRDKSFDLLILDIVLPLRMDSEPTRDAGLTLLRDIAARDQYHTPGYIVGLTAAHESIEEMRKAFAKKSWTVIKYDDQVDWEDELKSHIQHIQAARQVSTADDHTYHSDVAIICALDRPELDSIRRLPWDWTGVTLPNDDTRYHRAEVKVNEKQLTIYAAAATRMGMTSTAILASKIICTFRPRYLVMAGIAAGLRGMTNLGDVLVAETAWDYGSGKYHVKDGEHRFSAAPHQLQLQASAAARLRDLGEDTTALNAIRDAWPASKPETILQVRLGPIASGAAVIADLEKIQHVTSQHRKVIGLDMETYAVYAAAEATKYPQPSAISIKGVSDFADETKSDANQPYAAFASAQLIRLFIERYV